VNAIRCEQAAALAIRDLELPEAIQASAIAEAPPVKRADLPKEAIVETLATLGVQDGLLPKKPDLNDLLP